MNKIVFLLGCLACAGHVEAADAKLKPDLNALAAYLQKRKQGPAFNPSSAGAHATHSRPAVQQRSRIVMAENLKNSALAVTRQAWSPDFKTTLGNFVAKNFPRHTGTAANMLERMEAAELRRHVLAGATAVSMALTYGTAAAWAEDLNPANIAVNQGGLSNFASFLAVILGLSIPCVFLITLFIQSEAQGTATTYRQPDSIGGTRYEDE
mmetsp:Transcript_156155/g.271688  ORF Transcript_156155/g.271688 Transcript_156155/m.271688 type:complete len:209 (+) Transcript_156155:66-692(+)